MPGQQVIFAAAGPDRPGVMDEISQFVHERGGSIADSRSINLRGQFALLVLIGGSGEAIERLRKDLEALASRVGFSARIEPADGSQRSVDTFPYHFIARGTDRAKAIQRVSHLFRVLNINIESLETKVQPAPRDGGAAPFEMKLGLAVPRETPIVMLREYLTQLCQETDITFDLTAA